ncbi:MAG: leucyl aminopeptidase [Bacteroidales bacterium]|jgi:leucyl aminopeptidase|nr:leucyl aminopeptidase [Bacteroidales bacterium]
MIRLTTQESIPKNTHSVLLAESSCDFGRYGLTGKETDYVRKQAAGGAKQMSVRKDTHWIFIQIVDPSAPENTEKEQMRRDACTIHGWIQEQKLHDVAVADTVNRPSLIYAFAEGLALAGYRFLKYVSKKEKKTCTLQEIILCGSSTNKTDTDRMNHLLAAVYKARDMVNEPANHMNAMRMADEIKFMAEESGLTVRILHKNDIEQMKMGGILAVNKGSTEPPAFSILEWHPDGALNQRPVVLVGKGLTYDSGGLSLKPTQNSMDCMKCDMSGGAAVAATLYAVAKTAVPIYVVGLIPSTDNRISATAYAPGDIITMYDGTTVEVLNTDAEGRIILADALTYAKQYRPELVIDIATLTGAAHRAIGEQALVAMGNAPRKTMELLKDCGYSVHERIAEFPFWDDYTESLQSNIADLKNVGGELAGAITAGKFLEHFTDYPYIHLDIAGPAFLKKADYYRTQGGTGVGVRLLFDFLQKYSRL